MFEEVCPYYLQYGMTYDEFWHGDPWMVRAYRKKWKLQLQKENRDMWQQGLYFYDAISSALSGFSKKPRGYMDKPLPTFPQTKAEREAELKLEYQRTMNQLITMAGRAGFKQKE